ncbi:beta strand repeat-containing protein, partial [Nemorincola caseinilytica]|uniref:beta strand repeat-containing protein n=1 Tax=Nemorincola caseinilytica TaxID=2054315 RepID=UPI0031F1884E
MLGSRAYAQTSGNAGLPGVLAGPGNAWVNTSAPISDADVEKASKTPAAFAVSQDPHTNFTFISAIRKNPSPEVIQYNQGYEQHTELGMLFPEAPCSDCYELIEKRTETQKYFVKEGTEGRRFVLYSSQYPVHYKDAAGNWMTVRNGLFPDAAHNGVYHTKGRLTDVAINTVAKNMTLTTKDGASITYNNELELVYIKPDGTETSLGKANWANHTAGDDGVRITDAWPGIDIEMVQFANSVKTGFVVKSAMPAYAAGKLVLRDRMLTGKGTSISMPENTLHAGEIKVLNKERSTVLTFGGAIAYEKYGDSSSLKTLYYKKTTGNTVDILIPGDLLNKSASAYPLIIDPLVTGTVSCGFSYNATLPPPAGTYCVNTNNLLIPGGATITDLKATFSYYGPVGVAWNRSRINFGMLGCTTGWLSCGAATSSGIPGGTCGFVPPGTSLLGFGFGGCVPGYNCNSYVLPVQMWGGQNVMATAACVQTVYATATGFTVVVEGSAAMLPSITPPASTTLCMPSTMTLVGSPASGVWSSTAPGVATVSPAGVVSGVSNGAATIQFSASGCTATLPITVGTTPTITGASSICFPGSTTLTGSPGGGVWTSSAPGVATITGGGLVNAVSIGTTLISYNTGTCTAIRPFDVNSPTAVAPTTQPTGLVVSAPTSAGATINFTPNGSTGYLVIASTSPTLSATPTLFTTYATGSAFGGGIVIQGSASGSSPAYTTSLLNSNTRYYVFVFAFNNNCTGPQYNTVSPLTGSFNTCILAPTGLTVTTTGANSISLSWAASAVGGGYTTPINYNVYAYADAGLTILVPGFPVMAGIGTAYTVSGLATSTQYWFKVAPADACNNMSNVATGVTVCTAAGAITYLQTFEVGTLNGDLNPNCMASNVQNCVFSGVQDNVTYLGVPINTNHTPGGTKFYNLFRDGACSPGWANQWLLLPRLTLQAGTTYTFSVWYATNGIAWQTVRFQYSTSGTVPAVGSTTMGGVPGNIGTGLTSVSNTAYNQYLQTFTVPATGDYYIGIGMASGGASGLLAIDDIEVCAVPTITATNSAPPYCDPASVFLSSTGTSGATTYNWSGPSGYSSTLANPTAITGIGAGTYTYTLSAVNDPTSLGYGGYCTASATTSFTVSPPPPSITGSTTICVGGTTALSNPLPGGTWSSSTPTVGTVNTSGVVTGMSAGTTNITYNIGGCYTTRVVTVTSSPSTITGTLSVCLGAFTTLNSTPAGGTWSSSTPTIGTVSTTGVVYGASVGTTMITYGFSALCYTTSTVTVNANPTPIAGTFNICLGTTTTLTSTPPSGFWTSSAPGIASVNILSGGVTGNAVGTANITYTSNGCSVWQTVTVVPSPASIVGPTSLCLGFPTVTYTNPVTGGTWSSSNANVSIVGTSGVATGMSAGTSVITYALSATCFSTLVVTVTAAPAAPVGMDSLCVGATTVYSHPIPSGTWSASCPTILTVGLGTGLVTGVGAGTCIVTYTLPSGCIATDTVRVRDNPGAITGTLTVCQGATTALASSTPGGTWSSVTGAVGTIGSTSGILYGAGGGTTTISYILSTGCYTTATATVTAAPPAITGTFTVCAGSTTALTSGPVPPGFWGNTPTTTASVSGTGVVTGLAAGTTMVTYTTTTGCYDTAIVTIL